MKVVAYARTSTSEQEIGLDAQRSSIEAWAIAGNHEVVSWNIEQASGKDMNRPELKHALALVMEGSADGLVVTKVDRLSRSVLDFASLMSDFQNADKALVCIGDAIDTSTPTGRFVANILANLAQLERELIGARTRDALAELKRQGVRLGRPPSEDPTVQQVAIIRELHAAGSSQRYIADYVGVKPSTVRRLIA